MRQVFYICAMKHIWLFAVIFSFTANTSAQNKNDSSGIWSVDLGEIVVKNNEPSKLKNKVHSQHVYIVLNPPKDNPANSSINKWFVTRFPQPEQEAISLYSVEVKLKPYDLSMFDVKLLIYQTNANDTVRKEIPIDGSKLDKNGKLKVSLFEQDITLQQGTFYIGYGFHVKNIKEPFSYRMYASNKGEGAIIDFTDTGVKIISDPHIPYVFPFKMSYRKY